MNRILDIRFLVPPILTLLFIFLFAPTYFLQILQEKSVPLGLFIGPILVLGLGFIISSTVNLFVTRTPSHEITELEIWRALDKEAPTVQEQVHKRWHMTIANFNCLAATVLAPILLTIFKLTAQINPPVPTNPWMFFYLVALSISAFLFLKNGRNNHKSLMEIVEKILASQSS